MLAPIVRRPHHCVANFHRRIPKLVATAERLAARALPLTVLSARLQMGFCYRRSRRGFTGNTGWADDGDLAQLELGEGCPSLQGSPRHSCSAARLKSS